MGEIEDLVRTSIRESGLSQNYLAKRCGVSQSAISRFMAGETDMSVSNVDAIMRYLRVGVEPKKRLGRRQRGK